MVAASTTGNAGGFKPPRQDRSRETLRKIIEAAEELLDGRSFEDITVDEIINLAEVSRSSFYARFPSKEALLPALYDAFLQRGRSALADAVALDPASITPEVLVTSLVESHLRFLRRFQDSIATFDLSAMSATDRLQNEVIGQVADLYLACLDRAGDTRLREQVVFACRVVGSALLRAVAPPVEFNRTLGFSDERLVAEASAMAIAYLDRAAQR